MGRADLDKMSKLSPFELKDTLVARASRHSERLMLNAGRGNPNFLSTVPRHGFFQLGLFAMNEAERSFGDMHEGIGGLPNLEGITARFKMFAQARRESRGVPRSGAGSAKQLASPERSSATKAESSSAASSATSRIRRKISGPGMRRTVRRVSLTISSARLSASFARVTFDAKVSWPAAGSWRNGVRRLSAS